MYNYYIDDNPVFHSLPGLCIRAQNEPKRQRQCSVNILSKITTNSSSFDAALHKLGSLQASYTFYVCFIKKAESRAKIWPIKYI